MLHGNLDWVSNMKMDCSRYFRFCWVAWKEWHSWLDLLWKRLGFDYWVRVSLDPCYTGVSLFFCTRHHSKHSGLLLQNTLWECMFLALHLSHPGLILLAGSETQPWLLLSPAYSLPRCLPKTILWRHFVPRVRRAGSSSCLSLSWGTCVRSAIVWLRESNQL